MKNASRPPFRLALLFVAITPFATASLLLNPSGGTPVGLRGLDNQVTRDLGGTFSLYGDNITSVNVADDGFIGVGHVGGIFLDQSIGALAANTAFGGDAVPVIAAYYDLLTFAQGSTITDQVASGVYYAVTYQSLYAFSDTTTGHSVDAQIILFMDNATVGGFDFHPGDIAISYGNVATKIEADTFTVGVAFGANTFTGTPASNDGQLTNFNSLPSGPQFFLFRPDQSGFTVSIESDPTPEPASLALASLGLIGIVLWRRSSGLQVGQ